MIMSYLGIINHRNKLAASPKTIYQQTFKTEKPITIINSKQSSR